MTKQIIVKEKFKEEDERPARLKTRKGDLGKKQGNPVGRKPERAAQVKVRVSFQKKKKEKNSKKRYESLKRERKMKFPQNQK